MTIRRLPILPLCVAAALAAGCATTRGRSPRRGPRPVVWTLSALQARAAAIDRKAGAMRTKKGKWSKGDSSATFTAHYYAGALVLIRESAGMGDYGAATNSYYYAEDRLFHYQSDGSQTTFDPPDPPTTNDVLVRVFFSAEGTVLESRKSLDGKTVPIEPFELTAIRRHAAELARGIGSPPAGTAATSRGPTPLRFPPGATGTRVDARIVTDRPAEWIVTARQGQTMRLRIERATGPASLALFAGRRQLVANAREWTGVLPRTGDYRLRLFVPEGAGAGASAAATVAVDIQ